MSKCTALKLYKLPVFAPVSKDYYVEIEGQQVDVCPVTVSSKPTNELYRGTQRDIEETEQASVINFDFEGTVKIRIVCAWEIFYSRVIPLSKGIIPIKGEKNKGDEVSFEISEPGQYVFEVNGLHKPLHIFANPMETDKPDCNAPNVDLRQPDEKLDFPGNFYTGNHTVLAEGKDVLYFGPGIHHPHVIELKSNQSVYIDGGAIVYGTVFAENRKNIRIYGRGILSGARFKRQDHFDLLSRTMVLAHVENASVEGIIIEDAPIYQIATVGGGNINIDNIKIFSWRRNSDGIDIHNSRNVNIRNCFVRAFDDAIVIKGQHSYTGFLTNHAPTSDILVEKCVIWGDWGRAIEFGAETSADRMNNIVIRDCDVIHFAFTALDIQPCGDAPIYDILFEDIRVNDPIDPLIYPRLIEIFIRNMLWMEGESLGSVRNVTYRNISYNGLVICPCRFIGESNEHDIKNIYLENITVNGRLLESETDLISPVILNDYADDIYINGRAVDRERCHVEDEEETCSRYLVGNGAYIKV